MKLSDFKGLFKERQLYVETVLNPAEDYYVVHMKPEKPFEWQAGEHGIFTLPGKKIDGKKFRAFSVASIDQEGVMTIGFRTGKGVSSFKKTLIEMKAGEKVKVRGPFGWFKLQDKTTPVVMIASGVGITPIRALTKSLEDSSGMQVDIVYGSSDYHLFGDELYKIVDNNKSMTLKKTSSRDETVEAYSSLARKYENDAIYYVSGSQKVIQSVKENLLRIGIHKKRIINDPFLGY